MAELPSEWLDTPILIAPSHNHHGPDVVFDINPDYYEHLAAQAVTAIVEAVSKVAPATAVAATGAHRFGVSDGRDPIVFDPRLDVLEFVNSDRAPIVRVVQWNSHPVTTLG
ncbi:MAG: hypothetical protein ACKOCE_01075 [Acidimicrobiia bacterium]